MPVSEIAFERMKADIEDLRFAQAARVEREKSDEARLSRIEGILSRLTWIVLAAIGGAFMAFVINGGLSSAVKAASTVTAIAGGF